MSTVHFSASSAYGHSGQYVARITGRDPKYTFAREFFGSRGGKHNQATDADVDDPGIYETRDVDRKGKDDTYYFVFFAPTKDGGETLIRRQADKDEAMAVAKRLDAGESFAEIVVAVRAAEDWIAANPQKNPHTYEIRSKAAAKAAVTAQTFDSAVDACWAALSALPEKEAKKVLAALKLRVSPPAPKPDQVPAPEKTTTESTVVI